MYKICRWDTNEVIHEFGDTVKECLENGVKNGVDFFKAKLNEAELNEAELNGAKLNWVELNGAKLNGAKLNEAKLNKAELNEAELNGAKLNWVELNDAELNGAKLNGAELNGAELNGVELDFSAYPLHCGSLKVKNARRLFVQLCYHLRSFEDIEDPEIVELLSTELFTKVANKFCEYRTDMPTF